MEDFTKKAAQPWEAYALEDNRVITGQNPASGGLVAELVLKQLQKIICTKKADSPLLREICFFRKSLQNSNNFFFNFRIINCFYILWFKKLILL